MTPPDGTTFTALRVTETGIVLFEAHRRRLSASDPALARRFDEWAATASPGVYAAVGRAGTLVFERRPGSRLFEGIPTRFVVSPFAGQRGTFPKPAPPSPYAAVRTAEVASLLTDAAGREILESCAASVFAWDGESLVATPGESPRVASAAEACLVAALPHRRAPLLVDSCWPLVLVNAVAGVCQAATPGRDPFPESARREMEHTLARSIRRAL